MTSCVSLFKCEAVSAAQPETIHDDLLGELQIAAAPGKPEPKHAPVIIRDIDLGELLIASPAAPGNPRRTAGPPHYLNLVLAVLSMAIVLLMTVGAFHG